jgi:hypothetical protein
VIFRLFAFIEGVDAIVAMIWVVSAEGLLSDLRKLLYIYE